MKPAAKLYTVTGILLDEAVKELDRLLPSEAYKAMKAGNDDGLVLTNINPHFAMELISELFGILGLGWGYEELGYASDKQYCSVKIRCWYKVNDEAGNPVPPIEWTARGGNSNPGNREWAEKGALTNAISAAWSMQGLQASVYKGLRSHLTVDKEWRDRNGGKTEGEKETTQEEVKTDAPIAPVDPKPEPEPTAPAGPDDETLPWGGGQSKEAVPKQEEEKPAAPKVSELESRKGKMKAASMMVSQSKDGKTIYAKGKEGGNPAGVAMARELGGKWDSGLKPEVHGLKGKGVWVIPVPE